MSKKPRNPKAQQGAHLFVSPVSDVAYDEEGTGHRVMRKGKTERERAKRRRK